MIILYCLTLSRHMLFKSRYVLHGIKSLYAAWNQGTFSDSLQRAIENRSRLCGIFRTGILYNKYYCYKICYSTLADFHVVDGLLRKFLFVDSSIAYPFVITQLLIVISFINYHFTQRIIA